MSSSAGSSIVCWWEEVDPPHVLPYATEWRDPAFPEGFVVIPVRRTAQRHPRTRPPSLEQCFVSARQRKSLLLLGRECRAHI